MKSGLSARDPHRVTERRNDGSNYSIIRKSCDRNITEC